jgi:primosomal protein N' (replication factor Y)
VRARQQGIVVLLASATPSVVSYHNALCGKYRLLTMDNRVGNRSLPKVTLIDLRQQQPGGKRSLFRPLLRKALEENFAAGRQSVILINRRGFSSNVICQECGTPVQCRDCHVTLTLHRSMQQLLCHYCGYNVHEKTVCESCGSLQLVPVGIGTERVEVELQELLPSARIARLDTDTAKDRKSFLQTLKLMRSGEIDILVGTQMVAKGHHFPGVTLVGVVWADGGLAIPDYRAAEKTFQLITQVTGRAGRGDTPGEVYIQTMRPEHYAIGLARTHSYRALVQKELELRKNPAFPPFVRLVAIHIQGESEQDVERSADRIAAACRAAVKEKKALVEILGPAPSPIDRVKKNFRWQVMIKAVSVDVLDGLCSYVQQNQQELVSGRCRVMLDKDPENMM